MHELFKVTKRNVYLLKVIYLLEFVGVKLCVGNFRVDNIHGGTSSNVINFPREHFSVRAYISVGILLCAFFVWGYFECAY